MKPHPLLCGLKIKNPFRSEGVLFCILLHIPVSLIISCNNLILGSDLIMPIQNTLRDLRFELKKEQYDFADFLGVSKTLYNKWEKQNGQPSLEWATRLAKITGKRVEHFIMLVEN